MSASRYRHYTALLAFVLFLLGSTVLSCAEVVDRVVAVVDDDVITLSEVNDIGREKFARILRTNRGSDAQEKLAEARKEILDELINRRLVALRARERNITISEKEVDASFEKLLKRSNVSRDEFLKQLKSAGKTEKKFRESLREQLLFNRVMVLEIRSKIVVSDAEIQAYYKAHYTRQLKPGQYHVLQIGFRWSEAGANKDSDEPSVASRDAALKQAERIRKLAMEGKDFRTLAQKYSELPSSRDGGDIGILHTSEISSTMARALEGLVAGGVSHVIEVGKSFQFFKILATAGDAARIVPFDDVKKEIEAKMFRRKTEQVYNEWLQERRKEVYIEVL